MTDEVEPEDANARPSVAMIDLSHVPGWAEGDLKMAAHVIFEHLIRMRDEQGSEPAASNEGPE